MIFFFQNEGMEEQIFFSIPILDNFLLVRCGLSRILTIVWGFGAHLVFFLSFVGCTIFLFGFYLFEFYMSFFFGTSFCCLFFYICSLDDGCVKVKSCFSNTILSNLIFNKIKKRFSRILRTVWIMLLMDLAKYQFYSVSFFFNFCFIIETYLIYYQWKGKSCYFKSDITYFWIKML